MGEISDGGMMLLGNCGYAVLAGSMICLLVPGWKCWKISMGWLVMLL